MSVQEKRVFCTLLRTRKQNSAHVQFYGTYTHTHIHIHTPRHAQKEPLQSSGSGAALSAMMKSTNSFTPPYKSCSLYFGFQPKFNAFFGNKLQLRACVCTLWEHQF